MRASCGEWPGELPRLLIGIALALLCPAALAADPAPAGGAGCRMASGGQLRGLASVVVWRARAGCGDSTLVWFESPAGRDGTATVWRVDDLLIVPNLEQRQSLSLLSPLGVECRHLSDRRALVIAAGEWIPGAARQRVDRAWRVEPESRKLAEVPVREVSCVLR
jgi:hypothetical protein